MKQSHDNNPRSDETKGSDSYKQVAAKADQFITRAEHLQTRMPSKGVRRGDIIVVS